MVGVISIKEGVEMALEAGLDLVEVSPHSNPPVCKVLDYGKYKYEAQKKANEARKKQKIIEVKEIKMRPGIDEHDYHRYFYNDGYYVYICARVMICLCRYHAGNIKARLIRSPLLLSE